MPGQAVRIRKATVEDATAVLECLRLAFEPYRSRYTPAGFIDTVLTPEALRDRMREMTVFVAEEHTSMVVGTIAAGIVNAEEGHLRGMAVHPAYQGAGIAAQLLNAAENHLRHAGCRRVTLDTTEPLERARRFYERHGYGRSGYVADFFGMPLSQFVKAL